MAQSKKMDSIGTLTLRLLIITLAAGLLLGLVHAVTEGPIAEQEILTANESRKNVLPEAAGFEQTDIAALGADGSTYGIIEDVYRGVGADGSTVGYTMAIRTNGYSANLCLTVGIDMDDVVTGVDITSHEETAGLGANATQPEFLGQYLGADGPLTVVKTATGVTGEVQALTGATITSRAVTNAVNLARDFFAAYLQEGA